VHWKRKRRKEPSSIKQYSISKKLRQEKRSNEEFESMIASLSLEEVIALKLELSTRSVDGKLYALPLWSKASEIFRDALIKYAFSACRTQVEATSFIGLRHSEYWKLKKKYKPVLYFEEEQNNLTTQ